MNNSYWDQAVKLAPEGAKPDQVHPTATLRYCYNMMTGKYMKLQQQVTVTWKYNQEIFRNGDWTNWETTSIWMDIPEEGV